MNIGGIVGGALGGPLGGAAGNAAFEGILGNSASEQVTNLAVEGGIKIIMPLIQSLLKDLDDGDDE